MERRTFVDIRPCPVPLLTERILTYLVITATLVMSRVQMEHWSSTVERPADIKSVEFQKVQVVRFIP